MKYKQLKEELREEREHHDKCWKLLIKLREILNLKIGEDLIEAVKGLKK